MNLERVKRLAANAHVHGRLQLFLPAVREELSEREYKELLSYCDKFR